MNEKSKFYDMTKPIKYRGLKMVKQYLEDLFGALSSVIKYNWYNSLYKLHIIERYTYRDKVEDLSPIENLEFRVITTDLVCARVDTKILMEKYYDIDYFHKRGKLLYSVKDVEEQRLFFVSHLEDINLKVDNKWYRVQELPIFKVAIFKPTVLEPVEEITKPVKYNTKEFDIRKLKDLRTKVLVSADVNSNVTESMAKYFYDYSCDLFIGNLKKMTLRDLML